LAACRLAYFGIGVFIAGSVGAAPKPSAPAPSAAAVAAPAGPRIVGGLYYAAPGAAPFRRGSAPGVWVRDVPPSPPPAGARSFAPMLPGGAAKGFYSPRMTYTMPNGRVVEGPPLRAAKPVVKAAARAAKPAAGAAGKHAAAVAGNGGRK
jgi:hypothetical protein